MKIFWAGMFGHSCNHSTRKVDIGGSWVRGHPCLHRGFEASPSLHNETLSQTNKKTTSSLPFPKKENLIPPHTKNTLKIGSQITKFHSSLWLNKIPLHINITFSYCSSVVEHLGCFHSGYYEWRCYKYGYTVAFIVTWLTFPQVYT
jgi:hypothetical protein